MQQLTNDVQNLQVLVESLEKERDFYFAKLRDVEIQCQGEAIHHPLLCLAYSFYPRHIEWAQGTDEERSAVTLEEFVKRVQSLLYAED